MTGFTLAHFSDPHLGPLPAAGWQELASKRITGFLSWKRNRVKIHQPRILDLLLQDLKAQQYDHLAITGDLINISLPDEFKAAAAWLQRVGKPADVTIIPGNHDAYVEVPWAQSLGLWADYMHGSRTVGAQDTQPASFEDFPFVRRLGDVALIGTSTALPMPPFIAAGRLGEAQLSRLRTLLTDLGRQGLFRIVLIHHPPFGGGAYKRKALLDASAFQQVLAEAGAELVLHGHTHVSGLAYIKRPQGPIPVIGVPSASAAPAGHKDESRYHLYRINRTEGGWRLGIDVRGLNLAQDAFTAQGSMELAIPLIVSDTNMAPGVTTGAAA
ncbi:metallophosphoesterase [Dongia sp.]|uniref:metallophosphoesterase family protein n=1 Tax=Dongia sp. TaxID=1977262 RepID=UPI0035B37852